MQEQNIGIAYDKEGNITNIDCSNLVYQVHKAIGLPYAAYSLSVEEFVDKHPHYQITDNPLAGDMMIFYDVEKGIHHMGFYDPNTPTDGWILYGASSSKGVRYCDPGWWDTTPVYYTYVP